MPLSKITQIDLSSKTDAIGFPSGTTAQRPSSPVAGYTRYNTTIGALETYLANSASWVPSAQSTYTGSYLVVAGGGGGGGIAGGGGAGGMINNTFVFAPGTVYTATVGAGGGQDNPGDNSKLTTANPYNINIVAYGGGTSGQDGGSGGGGNRGRDSSGDCFGGAPAYGQGYRGGAGSGIYGAFSPSSGGGTDGFGVGAGGGGAGGRGGNAAVSVNSAGGAGKVSSIITGAQATTYSVGQSSGGNAYFAGGGGGGGYGGSANPSTGGVGGGGGGYGSNGTAGVSGSVNSGGGGGGAGLGGTGGSGGSGVVILSVPTANYTGTTTGSPTVFTSGSNTIIIFKSSGTYTA